MNPIESTSFVRDIERVKQTIAVGQVSAIVPALQHLVRTYPRYEQSYAVAADYFFNQHDYRMADLLLRDGLQHVPSSQELLTRMVRLAELRFDHFEKFQLMTQLCAVAPNNMWFLFSFGLAAANCARVEVASAAFYRCIEEQAVVPFLWLNLGHVLKAQGKFAEAAAAYHSEFACYPQHFGEVFWSLADLKNYKFTEADAKTMQTLLIQHDHDCDIHTALLAFSYAKCLEQRQDHPLAMAYYGRANQQMATLRPFKVASHQAFVQGLLQYKPPQAPPCDMEPDDLQPIFVVGMPRSGTTLIEQICCSHSYVTATDELPTMERIAISIQRHGSYAQAIANLTSSEIQQLRQVYLATVAQYTRPESRCFIDKNPINFLHIPLILKLFPQAKIINVIRHPAENAMAVYRQFFSRGHDYCYGMDGIYQFWRGYIELMQHWDRLFARNIYHQSFETLIRAPEVEIRKLLAFLNLPFESACLTFYDNPRPVLTPSSSQVRKPMDINALNQTKVFRDFLGEQLNGFDDLAELVQSSFFSNERRALNQ